MSIKLDHINYVYSEGTAYEKQKPKRAADCKTVRKPIAVVMPENIEPTEKEHYGFSLPLFFRNLPGTLLRSPVRIHSVQNITIHLSEMK